MKFNTIYSLFNYKKLNYFYLAFIVLFISCRKNDSYDHSNGNEKLQAMEEVMLEYPERLDSLISKIDTIHLTRSDSGRYLLIKGFHHSWQGHYARSIHEISASESIFSDLGDDYHLNLNNLVKAFIFEHINLDNDAAGLYLSSNNYFKNKGLARLKIYSTLGLIRLSKLINLDKAAYFAPNPDVPEAIQADNVTYAYNEFLKLTVEYGLIGVLLAVAVLWSLFFLKIESAGNNENNLSHLAARGGLLSILVFAQFSYPSDILPIRMLFVLFMAIVASHQRPMYLYRLSRKETVPLALQKADFAGSAVLYASLTVALITVYPASRILAQQYHAYKSWKDASDIYNVGAYPESLEDFELAYPPLKTNGQFLVQYGKALEMAEKYESSIELLNQAKVHLKKTILYTSLGNNYKALSKSTGAELTYLHAFNMSPARFYPLYLLAKLYDESGQKEKAVALAKEVIKKEVKIESTAIKEIREEMRKIMEKQDNAEGMSSLKGKGRKHNHQIAIASCPAPFLKKK